MTKRIVVVGAGLAGLFAACWAARKGAQVTLVASGRGGLALSAGRIEIWSGGPARARQDSPRGHPYRGLGIDDVRKSVEALVGILTSRGLAYRGALEQNELFPTPLGHSRAAALGPVSQSLSRLKPNLRAGVANIDRFRDFSSTLLREGVGSRRRTAILPDLPLPRRPMLQDPYATDLALAFDACADLARVVGPWKDHLDSVDVLFVPAVLGLRRHADVQSELEALLEIPVVEVPTLPPSVPGLRLEAALLDDALDHGVQFMEGSRAVGHIDGSRRKARCDGVAALTPGGMRRIPADAVILATGGALHGGWIGEVNGRARDSVFGLPIHSRGSPATWTTPRMADPQPYEAMGVRVDPELRPLGADAVPMFDNLFAAGGLLAGADRIREGSRQGIDLGTAYRAVENCLR